MKKIIYSLTLITSLFTLQYVNADNDFLNNDQYLYYRGQTCGHCAKVERYRESVDVDEHIHIEKKEVQQNIDNANELTKRWNELWILDQIWTPFLLIIHPNWTKEYVIWDQPIIDFFWELELERQTFLTNQWSNNNTITQPTVKPTITIERYQRRYPNINLKRAAMLTDIDTNTSLKERLGFLAIMMPAALSDSINPCAFAVMLLLLTAILSKSKDKKKALMSGLAFSLAVFITYFLLWIWIFKLLWTMKSLTVLKRIVWIIWILVWLANIKDYFRYWKWFIMEVPLAWRPAMQKIVKKVTSPIWAFLIWIVISLFLLPCSSGPYLTILWFLSAENQAMTTRWYIYLTIYNIIFVLPMIAIAVIVWFGFASAEKIWAFKNKNTKLIHLIVWLLMLGLGLYIIGSMYR